MVEQDRVAVGAGPDDALGAEGTAGAGDILDDDGLYETRSCGLGEEAADHVGVAARGKGDGHRNGSG